MLNIIIPDNVTYIGYYAFESCYSLKEAVIQNGVLNEYAFQYCHSLSSVVMGNNVTEIGNWCFAYCKNLNNVSIGNSLLNIGAFAFYNAPIKKCTCLAPTPPSIFKSFNAILDDAILYVPTRCGTKYKSSDWGEYFTNIIEMD